MIEFRQSPFKNGNKLLRSWYSIETRKYRASIGFGYYGKCYFVRNTLLNKIRLCFKVGEIILIKK